MSLNPNHTRSQRVRWWLLAVFILIAGVFFGWKKMQGGFKRWETARRMRSATESIARGDYRRAMLDLRVALEADPMNPAIMRTMAEMLEAAGAPAAAAQWRSRLDSFLPGDQKNRLAWACDWVKAGDLPAAERVLGMLKPEPEGDAAYHAAAAVVAMAKGDAARAERHWAEASRLEPKEDQHKLNLAALRLGSKDGGVHADAVRMLTELGTGSGVGAEATRALLGDACNYREWGKALQYADALIAMPNAPFSDKLARLTILRAMKSWEAAGYMTELKNVALSSPADLYLLFMWMNQHDLAMMVSEWSRMLPRDIVGVPPVCVAMADAYVRSSEWQKLREFLDEGTWAEADYLRRVFLARAMERLGAAPADSAQAWADALAATRTQPDKIARLERIVRLVIGWGWEQHAQEVMWEMIPSPQCPIWILGALKLIAEENADALQLQKLAAVRVRTDSKSAALRNDFAFYSLLTHSEEGDPHREAERLFEQNPDDSAIAVTRALSLYQQGKNDDALAITAKLPAAELQKPRPAFYHALFLTAKGDSATAAGYLAAASERRVFPEEKSLLDRARQTVAKAADEEHIAAAAAALRAATAAREAETEKAVEAARAARAQTVQAADDGFAELAKARRAAKAAADAEMEEAVQAARAARAAKQAAEKQLNQK